MNQPPAPPDPNALTQPIPIVQPPPRPSRQLQPQGPHRFGNVPLYLLARLVALAIDLFALAFVASSYGFGAFDRGQQTFAGHDQSGYVTLVGGSVAIAWLLAYLTEALTGTTLGKMTFALHTRRIDGGHAGGARVLVRYLFVPLDLLLIGPILALATRRHQTLGDLVAGTVVSASRIWYLTPIIGLAILGGLGYVQFAYAGGVSGAIEVAAVTSNVVPGMVTNAAQFVGLGGLGLPGIPMPAAPTPSPASILPTPQPQLSASGTPESPAPAAIETEVPAGIATGAPSGVTTGAPSVVTTGAPSVVTTNAPSTVTTNVPSPAPSVTENVDRPGYPTDPPDGSATADPEAQPTDRILTQ